MEVTRAEIEVLHQRVGDLKERVVHLEAQQPHINAALQRIEGKFDGLSNKISKAMWVIVAPIMALIVGVLFRAVASGAFAEFL